MKLKQRLKFARDVNFSRWTWSFLPERWSRSGPTSWLTCLTWLNTPHLLDKHNNQIWRLTRQFTNLLLWTVRRNYLQLIFLLLRWTQKESKHLFSFSFILNICCLNMTADQGGASTHLALVKFFIWSLTMVFLFV